MDGVRGSRFPGLVACLILLPSATGWCHPERVVDPDLVKTNLRLRAGPGERYRILKKLLPGTTVQVIGEPTGRWHHVSAGGVEGWTAGRYLKPAGNAAGPATATGAPDAAVVEAGTPDTQPAAGGITLLGLSPGGRVSGGEGAAASIGTGAGTSTTVARATAPARPPARTDGALRRVVTCSAYNLTPGQTDSTPFTGAWGDDLRGKKAIAVSRDLERLGLGHGVSVEIWTTGRDGQAGRLVGTYRVLDRMNSRWRNKIDLCMGTDKNAALQWGVRKVLIRWKRRTPA